MARPKSVVLDDAQVKVGWNDGHESVYTNRRLRESCPCALCQGEADPFGRSRLLPMMPDVPSDVKATEFRMVGLYAIAFAWSDGHNTGIYTYDLLLQVCECERCAAKRG